MIFDLHGFGPALVAGTLVTIQLALSSLALGLVLGLLGALAKTSPNKFLQGLGGTYSTIVRGVPELLWVLLIYFGTVSGLAALGEFLGVGSLEEIMRRSQIAVTASKEPFTFYMVAAFIYLGLTVIAMTGMHFLEKRASRGFVRSA